MFALIHNDFELIVTCVFAHLHMYVISAVQFSSATHGGEANVRPLQFRDGAMPGEILSGG